MNKFFIWIVGVLLLLSFVSAELQTIETKASINPFGNKKIILESITNEKINKDSFMLSEKSLDLPVVRISKTFLWVETDKIAEYKIIRNDVSIVNAETYGKAVLYQDGKLFDDAEFKDLKGQLKEIVSYQYYIKQNISYIVQEPATYKTQCVKTNSTNLTKGSLLETCYEVVDTYKDVTKYKEEWVKYNYETLKSGEYEWLLKGQRKANTKVDFIPKAQGLSLDEYVWWNEDWSHKRQINLTANVGNISYLATINYSDAMQYNFSDLKFVDCALETTEYNITRQAFVNATNSTWRIDTNGQSCVMMYYGNPTATSTSSPSNTYFNPVSYLTLDGNANDLLGVNNGTISGATYNSSGKIAGAYDFDGSNDYIELGASVNDLLFTTGAFSISGWFKADSVSGVTYIIEKSTSTQNHANYQIRIRDGVMEIYTYTSNDFTYVSCPTSINKWIHFVYTYNWNNNSANLFINGTLIGSDTATGTYSPNPGGSVDIKKTQIGSNYYSSTRDQYFNGIIDEVGIWSRVLTTDEITQLYTQTMPTYTIGNEIQNAGFAVIEYVTPPTPENNSNLSVSYIPVEVDVNYTNAILKNITFDFYKGGVLNASYFYENETYFVNHSGCTCDNWAFNVTLCYTENISDTSSCVTTETRSVIIDILPPTINITSPLESYYYLSDNQTLDLNFTVTDASEHLDSCWYSYGGLLDSSYTYNTSVNQTVTTSPEYQQSYILIDASSGGAIENDSIVDTSSCSNISLYSHTTGGFPSVLNVEVLCDSSIIGGGSSTIGFDNISYFYGSDNKSINCSENITFNYIANSNTLTLYANDTFGNVNSEVRSWNISILQNNFIFDNETFEGLNSIFINNVTLNGLIQNAYLEYAGVNYTSSITTNGYNYLYNSISIPSIETDTNNTFFWWILVNNTWIQSINNTQLVKAVSVINCSNGTLLNLTLQDERTQTNINGTFEVLLNIISPLGTNVITYNNTFTNRNNVQFCLAPNDTDKNLFELNAQIRYYSPGYVYELYNIQNANLSDYPQSIILYNIAENESTTFKVTYKGNNFVIKEGVLVQLLRKYIGEDSYKVVEAPVTSSLGEVILHVDLNNNLYNIIISEDGVVLDTYENIVFACDSELTGLCTFNLDGIINPYNSITVEQLTDIQYSISTINETHVMVTFSTSSGTPATVQLTVEENSITGQSQIYNNTVYSSAGSFVVGMDTNTTLGIGSNVYNFILVKDGEVIAIKDFLLNNQDMGWDNNNYFIVIILLLSVVGMAFTSPELVIFNAVLTFLLAGSIWLFQGMNFAIGLGALLWLVVAAGILIYKLSQQEDR